MRAWLALLVVAGCAPEGSRVRLAVRYDAAWALDGVQVTMAKHAEADARMAHELLLLVPDDWAGGSIGIDLWGVHKSERRAWGHAEVTPVKNGEVKREVVLTRLPCGEWCTPGAVECSGKGTVVCVQTADGCTDWGPPTMCPSATPFCAFGACAATCRDECAAGESRCEGASGVRTCGHNSDDTCLHWLPAVACTSGQVCSNGACAATCSDECTAGAVSCLEGGTITCGDLNHDGCQEWSPIVPCAAGTCSAGRCSTTCTDDCTTSECSGLTFRACGKFSADNCNHLSAGVSCVPADSCQTGRCGANGCESAPLVCEAPPASMCTDGSTLRVYDTGGTCTSGTCSYSSHDVACTNCPACDPSPSPSCAPACTGKSCGADDGCGGKCGHGCWTTAPSLPVATGGAAAVTLADGRILVFGGGDSNDNALNAVQELSAGTWSQPTTLPTARFALAAAVGTDRRVYVIGGADTNGTQGTVEVYTPDSPGVIGRWDTAPSLKTGRYGLGVVAAGDGRIYAIGGSPTTSTPTASVEAYTPGGSGWVSVGSLISARWALCASLGGDGRIYAAGGKSDSAELSTVETYSVSGGKWADVAPLGTARHSLGCASSSADGRIYALGGADLTHNALAVAEAYSPSTNQWTAIASMPVKRVAAAVTAGIDGSIYVIGGFDESVTTVLSTVEVYTP